MALLLHRTHADPRKLKNAHHLTPQINYTPQSESYMSIHRGLSKMDRGLSRMDRGLSRMDRGLSKMSN